MAMGWKALVLCLTVSTGCLGDDDECLYPLDRAAPTVEPPQLRNPVTGQCEAFGTFNPPPDCDDPCRPCVYPAGAAEEPAPTWGQCYAGCEGNTESDCLDLPGCRAIYLDGCPPDADCQEVEAGAYAGCWSIDTLGPASGDCAGLDAYQCSAHNDCVAIHQNTCGTADADPASCYGSFLACAAEEPECVGEDCNNPAGQCYQEATCVDPTPDCPMDTLPGVSDGCYTGYCIPIAECETPATTCASVGSEEVCVNRPDCTGSYRGEGCTCDGAQCTCTDWIYLECIDATP